MNETKIAGREKLYSAIMNELKRYGTDMDKVYFNIKVEMPERDILAVYRRIMKETLGDRIAHISSPRVHSSPMPGHVCSTKKQVSRCIPKKLVTYVIGVDDTETELKKDRYSNVFKGNCLDFLENFGYKDMRWFRVVEDNTSHNPTVTSGIRLNAFV